MKVESLIISAFVLLFAVSCVNGEQVREPNISAELTIEGLSDSLWTYFSFKEGATVGQSRYCDSTQDSLWACRKDWDFAICGELLKTNSGTSGEGGGGVQRNTTDAFSTLETAPQDGYLVDSRKRAGR